MKFSTSFVVLSAFAFQGIVSAAPLPSMDSNVLEARSDLSLDDAIELALRSLLDDYEDAILRSRSGKQVITPIIENAIGQGQDRLYDKVKNAQKSGPNQGGLNPMKPQGSSQPAVVKKTPSKVDNPLLRPPVLNIATQHGTNPSSLLKKDPPKRRSFEEALLAELERRSGKQVITPIIENAIGQGQDRLYDKVKNAQKSGPNQGGLNPMKPQGSTQPAVVKKTPSKVDNPLLRPPVLNIANQHGTNTPSLLKKDPPKRRSFEEALLMELERRITEA